MRHFLTILAALLLCSVPLRAQTLKSLMFNSTNGQVVANTGTNVLTFTNRVNFDNGNLWLLNGSVIGNAATLDVSNAELLDGEQNIIFSFTTNAVNFSAPISFATGIGATTRANLGFSTNLNALWTATNASNARSAAGLGATWLTNTDVTNFRTAIGLGTNAIIRFEQLFATDTVEVGISSNTVQITADGIEFGTVNMSATTRTNLGLGATWLTNTNVTNFRTAVGLGVTNDVQFNKLTVGGAAITFGETIGGGISIGGQGTANIVTVEAGGMFLNLSNYGYGFGTNNPQGAGITRTNLGLGATNIVTFAGLTNNGDITINQTTATNGLLFIRRTNAEPFLGLANLLASNNTTISNETLFRVGVAETNGKSAQFGFRSTNTNGTGVAVFSVYGYDALMQIGADASTNAVIYSGGGTNNEVMTLIRDGATEFARPLRFSTNASTRPSTNAPANTTNVAAWVEMRIGTNSYRLPLYQ